MLIVSKALRGVFLSSVLIVSGIAAMPTTLKAAEEINLSNGIAVHGYDVVAYFTQGKPIVGNAAFTAQHEGATYQFASAENRDLFAADPAKFAPQYGGYCAFGTAMGRKFNGDPQRWSIVGGKLYLNLDEKVQARWKENIPGFIRGADNNWSVIRTLADAQLESAPPAGLTQGAQ